jgi:hypothetical protein
MQAQDMFPEWSGVSQCRICMVCFKEKKGPKSTRNKQLKSIGQLAFTNYNQDMSMMHELD